MNISLYANRILRPIAEKKKEDIFDSIAITGMRASPGPGNISQPGPGPNPPDPSNQTSSLFSNLDDEYVAASARFTDLEFTVGQEKTISFWLKPDNLSASNTLNQKAISCSGTSEQWHVFVIAPENVNGSKLRFRMNSNSAGTTFFYRQTSSAILRNRWHFVTVTYNGGTTASSLAIYLNGASVATTTSSSGTFTTSYSNADLRLNLGRAATATPEYYSGNIAHLIFFNKVLSAGEVSTLYNSGTVYDYSTNATYLTNGLHYFPLSENYSNSTSTITLTNNGSTFSEEAIDPAAQNISFRPTQYGATRYDAFGNLIQISADTFYWIGRSGTTHLANGNIIKYVITPSLFAGSAGISGSDTSPVIDDASFDLRGGTMGLINGNIFVFSSLYDPDPVDVFLSADRYVSTDGTTGNTYGAAISMPVTRTRFNFYGQVTPGFAAGHFFVGFYEHTNAVEWTVSVFKTEDNGTNWSKIQVYDGLIELGEAALINLGNNTLLMLARRNGSTWGIWQMVSTDGGNNWSAPALTNLGTTGAFSNCEMCLDDGGLMDVVTFHNNVQTSLSALYLSKGNNVATILSNPLAYNTNVKIQGASLGYPNILNLGGNKRMIAVSTETSGSDVYIGIGDI